MRLRDVREVSQIYGLIFTDHCANGLNHDDSQERT